MQCFVKPLHVSKRVFLFFVFDVIKLLYFLTPGLRSISFSAAFDIDAAEG